MDQWQYIWAMHNCTVMHMRGRGCHNLRSDRSEKCFGASRPRPLWVNFGSILVRWRLSRTRG
eukprot:1886884-Pyramimonas_sp.AAC.1